MKRKSGLSLVELLVVIAILGVLMSLVLAAVQNARESARRVTCQSNLRQIGIAAHAFEVSNRSFPSNGWGYRWVADPTRGNGPNQPGGWIYQLTNHLEVLLPERNGSDAFAHATWRTEISVVPIGVFRCPSRPGPLKSLASQTASPVNANFQTLVPKTDYAANEGDFITNTNEGPQSIAEAERPNFPWTPTTKATGVIFLRSKIRTQDINDGLSNTYFGGEKNVSTKGYFDASDLGHDQSLFSGVDLDLNRWTIETPKRDAAEQKNRVFGSAHAAITGMLFCDASVHWVSNSIEPSVHRSHGNRRDGHSAHLGN